MVSKVRARAKDSVLVRSLFLNGFTVTAVNRGANQIEILCERRDLLGALVKYGIALTDSARPPVTEFEAFAQEVTADGRTVVAIAAEAGQGWLGWDDVILAMGGEIPSWRALDDSYADVLRKSSHNEPIDGVLGEAWSVFEQAVADGLEFILALRVRRHGGLRRGRSVSDMLAETSDARILVVDAKSSKRAFDVSTDALRQIREYVLKAKTHQKGGSPVGSAVLIAREFQQDEPRLANLANEFLAETQVPLAFLTVSVLTTMVSFFKDKPVLRRSIPWRQVFCQTGLIHEQTFRKLAKHAIQERIAK